LKYQGYRFSVRRELIGRRRSLRQIVSEKDFDADALLIGIDRFA
jgi:hypothetical protein